MPRGAEIMPGIIWEFFGIREYTTRDVRVRARSHVTHNGKASDAKLMYGDLQPFLEENGDVGLATRRKMLDLLHDQQKQGLLKIELAATVDAGLPLVQTTYHLEGDGPLVLTCFEEVDKVFKAIQVAHFPNLLGLQTDSHKDTTLTSSS